MTFAQFDHAGGPYVLCVWRKTGTGVATTPDRYVEIGIGGYKGRIVDSGAH